MSTTTQLCVVLPESRLEAIQGFTLPFSNIGTVAELESSCSAAWSEYANRAVSTVSRLITL